VGDDIRWGQPYTLRVIFDGMHYVVYLNGKMVLYRALTDIYPEATRLKVQQVGLAVNWEHGNDTGSLFRHFKAQRQSVFGQDIYHLRVQKVVAKTAS